MSVPAVLLCLPLLAQALSVQDVVCDHSPQIDLLFAPFDEEGLSLRELALSQPH